MKSDAIVVGTIGHVAYTPSDLFEIDTRYQILPAEVVKGDGHGSIDLSWQVVDHGGKKEEPTVTRIIQYEDSPTLVIGNTYVMFLRWSTELGAYIFVRGADSVYEVMDDATLRNSGTSELVRTVIGMNLPMLRAAITTTPR